MKKTKASESHTKLGFFMCLFSHSGMLTVVCLKKVIFFMCLQIWSCAKRPGIDNLCRFLAQQQLAKDIVKITDQHQLIRVKQSIGRKHYQHTIKHSTV